MRINITMIYDMRTLTQQFEGSKISGHIEVTKHPRTNETLEIYFVVDEIKPNVIE